MQRKPHQTESCWNGAKAPNNPRPKRHNQQQRKTENKTTATTSTDKIKKLDTLRIRFGETVVAKWHSINGPTEYTQNATTNCNRMPTENLQRRQKGAAIKNIMPERENRKDIPIGLPSLKTNR